MIAGKKILAVIPARGGSKGVQGKNIRNLAGKPLITWTIEAAKRSKYIDRLILSSDDAAIIAVAEQYGCEVPFIRPEELATDQASSGAVLVHALEQVRGYDFVLLLQPTSPLRMATDIDGCIERCINCNAPACVSVTKVQNSPYWMYEIAADERLVPLLDAKPQHYQRQQLPPIYELNGAVYVANSEWFIRHKTFITAETVGYTMTAERSIDIDTLADFVYAEYWMKQSSGRLSDV